MEAEKRYGNQFPTVSVVLPYENTEGAEAIERYEATGRQAQPWQKQLVYDILSTDEDGLYIHTKFGYSVPRRNGKGEILTMVELDALFRGRLVLHTAHRTTTSSSASQRLVDLLKDLDYVEVQRVKQGETYEKGYVYSKQYGLEKITLLDTNGSVSFRTRTSKGGLGEGFDTLVIDEAQEYTDDQQSSLQYIVSDSENPQIILCGTPPTAVSSGTVFMNLRTDVTHAATQDTGWAEWSVEEMSDVNDVDLWYMCNPAMGWQLNERKVRAEDKTDEIDFNIQRYGLWLSYNQKSAITKTEWEALLQSEKPKLTKDIFIGIKYGHDGQNVALSCAAKTKDGKIFAEVIDCQSVRNGNRWIVEFIKSVKPRSIVVDGASGQTVLVKDMKDNGIKKYILPKVSEVITAGATFERLMYDDILRHSDQPSLEQCVTNCDKRAIGSSGGFGYKSLKSGIEIALLDSMILAVWACSTAKEKVKQKISY